jgi:hypothetical protein
MTVVSEDGTSQALPTLSLPADLSDEIFRRSGRVRQLSLDLPRDLLLRSDNAASNN